MFAECPSWTVRPFTDCEACALSIDGDGGNECSTVSGILRSSRTSEVCVNLSNDDPNGEDASNWENDEANCGENNDPIDEESVCRGDDADDEGDDNDGDDEEEEEEEETPADSDEVDSSDEEAEETAAAACGRRDTASALSGDDEAAFTGLLRNCL